MADLKEATILENLDGFKVIKDFDPSIPFKPCVLEDINSHKIFFSVTLDLPVETLQNIKLFCERFAKIEHPSLSKIQYYVISKNPTFIWEYDENKSLEKKIQDGSIENSKLNLIYLKVLAGLAYLRDRKISLPIISPMFVQITDDLQPKIIGYGKKFENEKQDIESLKLLCNELNIEEIETYEEAIFQLMKICEIQDFSDYLAELDNEPLSQETITFINDAEKGDSEKCYKIHKFFLSENFPQFPRSSRFALKFLKLASDFGKTEAQFEYASYLMKKGETEKANPILKNAADKGHPRSAFILYSLEKDIEYLKKAAEGGVQEAIKQYALHLLDKDEQDAVKYLKQTFLMGDLSVASKLGLLLHKNANENLEILNEAEKYLKVAAELGDLDSILKLIEMYKESGKTFTNLLKAAADLGDTNSMISYAKHLNANYENMEREIMKYYAMAIDSGLTDYLPDLLTFAQNYKDQPSLYIKCKSYFELAIKLNQNEKYYTDLAIIEFAQNGNKHSNKIIEYLDKAGDLFNKALFTNDLELLKTIITSENSSEKYLAEFLYAKNLMKKEDSNSDEILKYLNESSDNGNVFSLNMLGIYMIQNHRNEIEIKNGQAMLSKAAISAKPTIQEMLPFPTIIFFDKEFKKSYLSNIKLGAELNNPHCAFLYAFMITSAKEKAEFYRKSGDLGIYEGYIRYNKLVKKNNENLYPLPFEDIPEKIDYNSYDETSNFLFNFKKCADFQRKIFDIDIKGAAAFAQELLPSISSIIDIYRIVHNIILAVDLRPRNITALANFSTALHFLISEELQNRFRDLLIEECCSSLSRNRSRFLFIELCIDNFMFSMEYFKKAVCYMKKHSNNFNKFVELWFPEVRSSHQPLSLDYFYSGRDAKYKDKTLLSDEYIIKNRKLGNPDSLATALRNDNLVALKKLLIEGKKAKLNSRIPPSFFELSSLLDNHPSLLSYAAFFGSKKCYAYLIENSADTSVLDDECLSVSAYAAASGDYNILAALEDQNEIEYQMVAEMAAYFHRSELLENVLHGKSLKLLIQNQNEQSKTVNEENKENRSPKEDDKKPERKLTFFEEMVAGFERERLANSPENDNKKSKGIPSLMAEFKFPDFVQNDPPKVEDESVLDSKIDDLGKVIEFGLQADYVFCLQFWKGKIKVFDDNENEPISIFYEICERGNTEVLRFFNRHQWQNMLIESIQGGGRETILTRLAAIGRYDTLTFLLEKKEIRKLLSLTNYYGKKPFDIAQKHKKSEIIELFEKYE